MECRDMSTAITDIQGAVTPHSGSRKNLILAVMSLSTFMIFLDGTVVNTALPAIARDFTANNSVLQWVVNSYGLLLAGLLLLGGTVGDRFGRRRTLGVGMLVFGIGAVGAALSANSGTLIVMRGLQGVGAAFVLPATLSIITNVFPRAERARAIAIWTGVGSLGIVVGPALGGLLVDQIDWSAVFWLHIPVVIAAIAGLQFVPESRDSRKQPLDLPGATLVTLGLLGVVYGIIQGGDDGWTSGTIIGSFVAGGVLLAAFVLVEVRSSHPMLPLRYFKRRDFTGSFLVIMLLMLAMVGVFFFLTQYFQLVQGKSALYSGLALMPIAATMMAGAAFASKTESRLGPRTISVIASVIIMGGMGVFTQLEVDSGYLIPALGLALFGLGAGMIMTVLTDSIMASVPVDDAGVGSAMNDTSRELGFALGIAIVGSVVTGIYRSRVTEAIRDVVPESVSEIVGDSLGSVGIVTQSLSSDVAAVVIDAANRSFVDAMSVGYLVSAGFIGLALAIAITVLPNHIREQQAEEFDTASLEPVDRSREVVVSGNTLAPAVVPVRVD